MMATRKPKDPRDELDGRTSSSRAKGQRTEESDTAPRDVEAAGTSDESEVPVVIPPQTEPNDVEDASNTLMDDRPSEDTPATFLDDDDSGMIPGDKESEEAEQPPLSPSELVELLSSPRAAAAIASLTSGFASGGAASPTQPQISDLVHHPGDTSPQDIQQLPLVRDHEKPAIELLSDAGAVDSHQTETPLMGGRSLQFSSDSHRSRSDVQRLVIEVEISVANAEQVTRIAVGETKRELKLVALSTVEPLEKQFWQLVNEIRMAWR